MGHFLEEGNNPGITVAITFKIGITIGNKIEFSFSFGECIVNGCRILHA